VNFISSCTNIQKVIESLKSRLIVINLEPLQRQYIQSLFRKIKNNETIDIDDSNNNEVEHFILDICNTNVKMMINYMEKFKLLNQRITLSIAKNTSTNISFFTLENYIQCILHFQLKEAIDIVYSIYNQGYSTIDILDNLFNFIKITDIVNDNEKYLFIQLICKYIAIFYNVNEDIIEVVLFTNDIIQSLQQPTQSNDIS
jgi:DNA polymerase III gamma/tau subunit